VPRLLRLPDHAGERNRGSGRRYTCRRRRRVRTGGKRSGGGDMLYGAAGAGVRAMSGSSGPGISLMQEGFSYIAGAELPCVIADIMPGSGPGQHRAGAGRLQPDREGRRARQLPHAGAGAGVGAGDGRPDDAGVRPGGQVPQSGGGAGGRVHRQMMEPVDSGPDRGAGAAGMAVTGTRETRRTW